MNTTKRNTIITMLILTLILFTFAGAFNVNGKEVSFSDFASSHWAYNNVKVLVEEGAIGGYPDGTFRPSGNITCAEFIKIAMVQAGFDGAGGVGAKWYTPYVDFAYDKGIIEKGIFSDNSWNKPITRDKMCYVIAKVGEYLGEDFTYTSEVKAGMDSAVTDVANMSEPYKTCVYKAVSKGIVTGYANNKHFEPSWNATRAEASAMLSRLTDKTLRVTTHFVSTIKKGTKEMVDALPSAFSKETLSPTNGFYKDFSWLEAQSAKDYILETINAEGFTVYFDKDNECKCAVGYVKRYVGGDILGFTEQASREFFTSRGHGKIAYCTDEFYYKDGSLDNSKDRDARTGQSIDNVALVILDIEYEDGVFETWVIENPIIDKEGNVYKQAIYGNSDYTYTSYWWDEELMKNW